MILSGKFCIDQDYPLWIFLQRSGLSSFDCFVRIRIFLSGMFCISYPLSNLQRSVLSSLCRDQYYHLWNDLQGSGLSSLACSVTSRIILSGFFSRDQDYPLQTVQYRDQDYPLWNVLQRSVLSSLGCSVEIRIILSRGLCNDQDYPLSIVLWRSGLSSLECSVEIRIILSRMFCRDRDYPLSNVL